MSYIKNSKNCKQVMQPIQGSNFTLASYKCEINHKPSKSCKIE